MLSFIQIILLIALVFFGGIALTLTKAKNRGDTFYYFVCSLLIAMLIGLS